jgi:hypothetical protein
MDDETIKYIMDYFSQLMTDKEKLALKHAMHTIKLGAVDNTSNIAAFTKAYREIGWLTDEQDMLDLLKEGYESFRNRVATRILNEHKEKIFLNYCSKCGRLARTPNAKQCRHCGHNWHNK